MYKIFTKKMKAASNAQPLIKITQQHRGSRGGCGGLKKRRNKNPPTTTKNNNVRNNNSRMNPLQVTCNMCKSQSINQSLLQSVLLQALNSDCLHHITKFLGTDNTYFHNNKCSDPYNKYTNKSPCGIYINYVVEGLYPTTMAYMGKHYYLDPTKMLYRKSRRRQIWCCNNTLCMGKFKKLVFLQQGIINSPLPDIGSKLILYDKLYDRISSSIANKNPPDIVKTQIHATKNGYCGYTDGDNIAVVERWIKHPLDKFRTRNDTEIIEKFELVKHILNAIFDMIDLTQDKYVCGKASYIYAYNIYTRFKSVILPYAKLTYGKLLLKWIRRNTNNILPLGNMVPVYIEPVNECLVTSTESTMSDNFTYYNHRCPQCKARGRIRPGYHNWEDEELGLLEDISYND
jgi:hypothetical protein